MARRGRSNMKAKSVLDAGRLKKQSAGGGNTPYFRSKNRNAGFRTGKTRSGKTG